MLFSLQAQAPINPLDDGDDERLPSDQITNPIQQVSVQQMRFVPRIGEHAFEIDFLLAEGTDLLFAHDAPSAYTKLVEGVAAR